MSVQRRPKTGKDKNGQVRWVARYRDAAGKEYAKTFSTKSDAKTWESEQLRAMRSGTWVDPVSQQITVGALVQDYIDLAERPATKSARKTTYAHLGELTDLPCGKLNPGQIKIWVDGLRTIKGGRPLSVNSKNTIMLGLSGALTLAVERGILPRNPAAPVKIGNRQPFAIDAREVPTDTEIAVLREYFARPPRKSIERAIRRRHQMALAVDVAITTGMRRGEILGLTPAAVDRFKNEISVTQQVGVHR